MGVRHKIINFLPAIVLFVCSPALADTVFLEDGSVLKGQVELLRDGVLTLKTDYAGTLEVSTGPITGVATDRPMILSLEGGRELSGHLAVSDDGSLRFEKENEGSQPIIFDRLVDIRPLDTAKPVVETDGPWSGRFLLGVAGASGNSDTSTLDVSASAQRETEDQRLSLEALVHKASQDGVQTEDEIRGTARLERDYSARAFVFGEFEAERDQFEDVDLRYRLAIGPGYFFVQEPDHELKGRIGLGFEQERFEDSTENNFVLTLGYDYRVDLWEFFRLTHEFTAIPDIGDDPSENYRLESVLGGELPLGSIDSLWRLRAEWRHEYDNNPEPGIEELDSNYLLSIVRDFE